MKKVLSLLLIILTFSQSISTVTHANCDMSYIDEEQINFTRLNKKGTQSISQTIGNKVVTVTRFDDFSSINDKLYNDVKKEIKNRISIESRKINPSLLEYFAKGVIDLILRTNTTDAVALKNVNASVSENDANKLSIAEQKSAVTDGKVDSLVTSLKAVATSKGIWETAKYLAKCGVGKIEKVAGAVCSKGGASVIGGLLVIGGFFYNYVYIVKLSKESDNLINVYKEIYRNVYDGVIDHKWLNSNVLITAVPKDTSCSTGYARFHYIDGLRYNKSQKAIDWEFAKSECRFLNEDHDDCYLSAKETINCHRANQDDPSKCRNSKYYKGTFALDL